MEAKKPIKLYFLITFCLFIVALYFGIIAKQYLGGKIIKQGEDDNSTKAVEMLPENVQQSRAVFGLAGVIGIILVIIYASFKLAMFIIKRRG